MEKLLRQVLIKGCLEATYLLTARVFSIYVPHFQGILEMECLSPSTGSLLLLSDPAAVPYLLYSMARGKADGGRGDLRQKIDLAFG